MGDCDPCYTPVSVRMSKSQRYHVDDGIKAFEKRQRQLLGGKALLYVPIQFSAGCRTIVPTAVLNLDFETSYIGLQRSTTLLLVSSSVYGNLLSVYSFL